MDAERERRLFGLNFFSPPPAEFLYSAPNTTFLRPDHVLAGGERGMFMKERRLSVYTNAAQPGLNPDRVNMKIICTREPAFARAGGESHVQPSHSHPIF